jgi:protoporphyrinogen oxidase
MHTSNLSILGGGWAGLLVARKAIDSNINDISIIEASTTNEVGGLLKTELIDGFTVDCGGPHLLFSRNKDILGEILGILGTNYLQKKRNNFVFYNNQYISYPFENGIYKLSPKVRVKFINSIIERMIFMAKNQDWRPINFLEWITGFFGDYMADEYLIPYNNKIWKRPLDKLAADWVFTPGRLPFPVLGDMVKAAAGISNVGYKEQAYFYYPEHGGIYSLFKALYNSIIEKGINYVTNEPITDIRIKNNNMFNINGKITSKKLISTIPLPELLLSIDKNNYKNLANKFDYNSVVVVAVGINKNTPNQTTVYVPEQGIIFHRYTWMSSMVPPTDKNKSNLIAEITIPKGEIYNEDKLVKQVVDGLLKIGIIEDENQILFTKAWFNRYGYPIYALDHNEIRNEAQEILGDIGIRSVGRWGSWHYWNTDMVYKAVNDLTLER